MPSYKNTIQTTVWAVVKLEIEHPEDIDALDVGCMIADNMENGISFDDGRQSVLRHSEIKAVTLDHPVYI